MIDYDDHKYLVTYRHKVWWGAAGTVVVTALISPDHPLMASTIALATYCILMAIYIAWRFK